MNSLMNTVTITPLYAALLGLVLFALSVRVIVGVRAKGVGIGDGGNDDHLVLIHANFIEYVPMALILIGFAEAGGASDAWIHGLGGALLVGRICHPLGMSSSPEPKPLRFIGTISTLLVLLITSVLLLLQQTG